MLNVTTTQQRGNKHKMLGPPPTQNTRLNFNLSSSVMDKQVVGSSKWIFQSDGRCMIGGVANNSNIGICHGVLLMVIELVNDGHVAEVTRVLSE